MHDRHSAILLQTTLSKEKREREWSKMSSIEAGRREGTGVKDTGFLNGRKCTLVKE